ncbi:hypothetical protein [Paenibacillus senegalensis]|uniref:hypothetical protein n=1 Tax=Paenibacillus senegalensis TaxID=1465766 RepID=UPI0002884B2C|nr:hypothetical protein [Paenibacillus senegalensis]
MVNAMHNGAWFVDRVVGTVYKIAYVDHVVNAVYNMAYIDHVVKKGEELVVLSRVVVRLAEIVLGIVFLGAGLNGFLVVVQLDPIMPTSAEATEFLGDGYLLAIVKSVETVCGLLLLLRRFVPLSLLALVPLAANILAFHLFVDPGLLPLAVLVTVLTVFLLWVYRASFAGLLHKKADPSKRQAGS